MAFKIFTTACVYLGQCIGLFGSEPMIIGALTGSVNVMCTEIVFTLCSLVLRSTRMTRPTV